MTDLDRVVADFGAEHRCASIAWGVVTGDELTDHGGFVHPEASSLMSAAPTPTTRFRIASMTKSFSAAATLALRDDGVLRLDDEIGRWAPELATVIGPTTDAAPITIRDLLTMTSGLVTDDPWADRHLDLQPTEFDRIVSSPMVFAVPTGSEYEYSNFGFALLGRVIERATGRSLQAAVSERLLRPLGLDATGWDSPPAEVPTAPPVRWYDDVGFSPEQPPLGDGMIAPMGGLWSTIRDIATWVTFLDDAFPARDEPDSAVLARSSRREMQRPHVYVGRGRLASIEHAMSYGLGLRVLDEDVDGTRPRRVVNHSGGFPGYGSNMRWLPGQRIGVVAFANTTYAPMSTLTALLLNIVAPPQPSSRRQLSHIDIDGLGELAVRFADWCRGLVDDHDDRLIGDLFADNVVPDLDIGRRRATLDRLHLGDTPSTDIIDGGTFRLTFEAATIAATVAPGQPYRIQSYRITRTETHVDQGERLP